MDAIGASLEGAHRIIVTTHVTPDGDGVGSALALARYLRSRGKLADIVNCSTAPLNLRFLFERHEFAVFEPERHASAIRDADAIVATDIGGAARLGKMEVPVRESRATRIVIDHHVYENDLFDLPLIWPEASSSSEITWRLLRHLGATIDRRLAEPLYVGLVTDTGNFCYAATSPEALRMAADLVEAGVDPHETWRRLHCTMPLAKMRLLGQFMTRLRLEAQGRVVWVSMDGATLERSRVPARDAFEIVNHFLHIQGVEVGVFFMEITPTRTKVSLRSAGGADVAALAAGHGGGGHRFAAGCTVDGPNLADAVTMILDEVKDALGVP